MYDDFLSVLELVKNPDKFQAKVDELIAHEKAIQEAIVQLNVVGDIDKARKKAEAMLAKAESIVAEANVQAEKILAGAASAYDQRHKELKEREVIADQAIANYNTIKAQQTQRENDLRASEKFVEQQKAAVAKELVDVAVKQAELDARLEKLRQAMG